MKENIKQPKIRIEEKPFSISLKEYLREKILNIEKDVVELEGEKKSLERGKRDSAKQQIVSNLSKEIKGKKREIDRLEKDIINPSKETLVSYYRKITEKFNAEEKSIDKLREFSKSTKTEEDHKHIMGIIKNKSKNLSWFTDELQKIKDTLEKRHNMDIQDLEQESLAA